MKISIDDQEFFTLSEIQKKVIQNDINDDIFNEDMKRRIQYILMHKYEKCLERLEKEWIPKLSKRMPSIPTNKDALCELIFNQPDYESKKLKESKNRL